MTNQKSIISSFFWSFLEQGGIKAVNLLVQIVLARLLDPDAFGVLAIMLVVVNIADAVAQSGMGTALVQASDVDDDSYTTAFWICMGVAILMYIVIFLVAPAISAFYAMPGLALYLRVISLVLLTNSANSIQRAYLQKEMDFKSLFIANTIAALGSGILGIASAAFGLGVWALIVQSMSLSILACIALLYVVPWKPDFVFRRDQAYSLFSYGWKLVINVIINALYSGISEIILGRTVSAAQLGYYSQGRKWPNAAISAGSNAIQNVMFPALAKRKDDPVALRRAMRRALQVGNYVVVPLSLGIAAMGEPLVSVLLGEKWLACVPIFQAACIANAPSMIMYVNLRAYMAVGDSGLYLRINIIKVGIGSIIIGGTAVAMGDIYAVAYVTAAYSILTIFLVDLPPAGAKTGFGWVEQIRLSSPVFLLGTVVALATGLVSFLSLPTWVLLVVQSVVYVALYVGFSAFLRLEGYLELRRIVTELRQRKAS